MRRSTTPRPNTDADDGGIDRTRSDGNGRGPESGDTPQPATARQIEFIRVLASQIRGLGVRRLDAVTETLCGKPLTGLSNAEASALIDVLKNVRAGKLDLEAALKGACGMNSTLESLSCVQAPARPAHGDYVSPSRLNLWLRCPLGLPAQIRRRRGGPDQSRPAIGSGRPQAVGALLPPPHARSHVERGRGFAGI